MSPRPLDTPVARRLGLVLAVGAACWLAWGFVVGVNPDDEEYWISVPSTLLAARALAEGHLGLWTSAVGLGMPQPFAQSFTMHPLMPLLAVLPVPVWVALLYSLHLGVAVAGAWGFARRVGASSLAAGLAAATYVLASPALNYALTDFWPSIWIVYTLAPGLALAMLTLAGARSRRERSSAAAAVGVMAGLLGACGHHGFMVVFVPGLALFLLPHWRAILGGAGWWLLATAIALCIAAPTIQHLQTEISLFPGIVQRENYPATPALDALWDVFARPLGPDPANWFNWTYGRGTRVVFFGGPAAALAVLYLVRLRTRWDLVFGLVGSLVLLNLPQVGTALRFISAAFAFRDPVILFAVPAAALALDGIAARRPRLAGTIVAAQVVVLAVAAWPFIWRNGIRELGANPPVAVYTADRPLSSWLVSHAAGADGGRVYYSPDVDGMLNRGDLVTGGLWRNSMLYRGVSVVNGRFKGVSIESVATGSVIGGQREALDQPLLLDVAGIRWVLARDGEAVPPGFVERGRRAFGPATLVLHETAASRGAAFVTPGIRTLALPLVPGCAHRSLFCRDFAALAPLVDLAPVRTVRQDGEIALSFAAAAEPRLLLVGEMFRPGWRADVGTPVELLLGALVGVTVPGGADHVVLAFRPPVRVWLARAAWAMMVCAAAVAVAGRRHRTAATFAVRG